MLTPLQEIEHRMAAAIHAALGVEADPAVAPSQNPQFGDYQSNAAMQIVVRLKKEGGDKSNPRQIAERIVAKLDVADLLAAPPSIAGPGFINMMLAPSFVAARCTDALREARLGVPAVDRPERVVVEYSSPNIAKQMHVGHIRSTILGDAAARVLEFLGHEVMRQNHVGDWGTQFGMLIAYIRRIYGSKTEGDFDARFLQQVGESSDSSAFFSLIVPDLEELERLYKSAKRLFDEDDGFRQDARADVIQLQAGNVAVVAMWKGIVFESMRHIDKVFARLGVKLNLGHVRGESAYNDVLSPVTSGLRAADVAVESEGALVSFAGGFKAPLMIRKSDGGYGYGTTDLAAAYYRTNELRADRVIYFVDARQSQHFKQVFATVKEAASKIPEWKRAAEVRFEHASFGSVLGEDGTPIKTREGESVKLADLLDEAERRAYELICQRDDAKKDGPELSEEQRRELAPKVGIGAVKYADLSKDRESDYVFSFDQMLSLDGNTAPYLQYAYARVRSILRKGTEQGVVGTDQVTVLDQPQELALAKHLLTFGDTVRAVARDLKPHVLCLFLYEAAKRFSVFYESCPVLRSEGGMRTSRMALTELTGRTLAAGLDLLGIQHPDRM